MFKIAIAAGGDFRELSKLFASRDDANRDARKLRSWLPSLQVFVVPVSEEVR